MIFAVPGAGRGLDRFEERLAAARRRPRAALAAHRALVHLAKTGSAEALAGADAELEEMME
jgi:hypothetical protein